MNKKSTNLIDNYEQQKSQSKKEFFNLNKTTFTHSILEKDN